MWCLISCTISRAVKLKHNSSGSCSCDEIWAKTTHVASIWKRSNGRQTKPRKMLYLCKKRNEKYFLQPWRATAPRLRLENGRSSVENGKKKINKSSQQKKNANCNTSNESWMRARGIFGGRLRRLQPWLYDKKTDELRSEWQALFEGGGAARKLPDRWCIQTKCRLANLCLKSLTHHSSRVKQDFCLNRKCWGCSRARTRKSQRSEHSTKWTLVGPRFLYMGEGIQSNFLITMKTFICFYIRQVVKELLIN